MLHHILKTTNLPESSIKNTLALLAEDCTIPFIARYRKERTGNLDEVQIEQIVNLKEAFETLEKRKATILKAMDEQGELRIELKRKISEALELIEKVQPKKAYLTHISHLLGFHDAVEAKLPANVHLAFDGLKITV